MVRLWGERERERECDRVLRRRLGGGDVDAEGERVRVLRERLGIGDRFLSLDRWLRLSLERCFSLPADLSRLRSRDPSRRLSRDLSRRLSLEECLFRSLEPSRFLSLDSSRGFLYGSGDGSRLRRTVGSSAGASFDVSLGFCSREALLEWRRDVVGGSTSCCVSSLRALYGDRSLAMSGPCCLSWGGDWGRQ